MSVKSLQVEDLSNLEQNGHLLKREVRQIC